MSCAGDQEIPKPIIRENPESQNAFKGENMTLNCTAAITGEDEPTIQWKKDNVVSGLDTIEILKQWYCIICQCEDMHGKIWNGIVAKLSRVKTGDTSNDGY